MLSKLSRWPMLNPMTTEQRIAELQTSVRYSRTSVSRERVMSDWADRYGGTKATQAAG